MFSIWYCARHCSGPYVQYVVLRETLHWPLCSMSGTARDTVVALMFSIWYCARHCSGSYVQYLVLRETLQWLFCSVSGTARDTAGWLSCSVHQYVYCAVAHSRTKLLYLLYSIICCRRYAVSLLILGTSTQRLCQFAPYSSQKKNTHFLSTTKTNLPFLFRAVGSAYCNKMNMQAAVLNCAPPTARQLAAHLLPPLKLHWEL